MPGDQVHHVGAAATSATRVVSIDIARGIAVAGMIAVNFHGSWEAFLPILQHAEWRGYNFVDVGFPSFLLLVGIAIVFSVEKHRKQGMARLSLAWKATRRTGVLVVLGIALAAFPFVSISSGLALHDQLVHVRLPGVLQRIGICYLAATLLFLYVRPREQYALAAAVLLLYWAALALIPVADYGAGQFTPPEATLPAYVDRILLGGHLYGGDGGQWDPEGILSTIPAIVTTLAGVWIGRFLRTPMPDRRKVAVLFGACLALTTAGALWDRWLPINKALWTSSYAVFSAGHALGLLAIIYWLTEVRGWRRWGWPFVVFGINAITVYVASMLFDKILKYAPVHTGTGTVRLKEWIFATVFETLAPPAWAALLYAATLMLLWFGLALALYRRGVVFKV